MHRNAMRPFRAHITRMMAAALVTTLSLSSLVQPTAVGAPAGAEQSQPRQADVSELGPLPTTPGDGVEPEVVSGDYSVPETPNPSKPRARNTAYEVKEKSGFVAGKSTLVERRATADIF